MPAKGDFPGLQTCIREARYKSKNWVCSKAARKAGYPVKSRNLDDYQTGSEALSDICNELQDEMYLWLAERKEAEPKRLVFDGTVTSMLDLYQTHKLSPYRRKPRNSRKSINWQVGVIRRTVGTKRLEWLEGIDFLEWYWRYREPKEEGDPDTIAKAVAVMKRVRAIFSFAVLLGLPHAKRLREALALIEFENAPARTQQVTFDQSVAFIKKAHELGWHEMALGQALQFELMLRQTDVIGKYDSHIDTPSVLTWVSGLRWEEIDGILVHRTGKRGHLVRFNLDEYPLIQAEFERYEILPSIGPMILNSKTGQPFRDDVYTERWRVIADAIGIPKDVWNRDTRAGGVTEAGDAGAEKEDMRQHAGHASPRMTERYNRASAIQTARVERLRVAFRTAAEARKNAP